MHEGVIHNGTEAWILTLELAFRRLYAGPVQRSARDTSTSSKASYQPGQCCNKGFPKILVGLLKLFRSVRLHDSKINASSRIVLDPGTMTMRRYLSNKHKHCLHAVT